MEEQDIFNTRPAPRGKGAPNYSHGDKLAEGAVDLVSSARLDALPHRPSRQAQAIGRDVILMSEIQRLPINEQSMNFDTAL